MEYGIGALAILLSMAVVSGCGNDGLSKGKAEKAIQKALDEQKPCYYLETSDPNRPIEITLQPPLFFNAANTVLGSNDSALAQMRTAGLMQIEVAYNKTQPITLIGLTEAGKKLFVSEGLPRNQKGALCAGERVVTEIVNWTDPAADATGVIVSRVVFKAETRGVPKGLFEALIEKTPELAVPVRGEIQLKKMSDGWTSNGMARLNAEASDKNTKVSAPASLAKIELAEGDAFVGELDCGGKAIGYAVNLKSQKGNEVMGKTTFFPTAANPSVTPGCFSTKGTIYPATGIVELDVHRWINQPKGYSGSGLVAVVNGTELSGKLPNESCKSFTLKAGKLPDSVPANCHAD